MWGRKGRGPRWGSGGGRAGWWWTASAAAASPTSPGRHRAPQHKRARARPHATYAPHPHKCASVASARARHAQHCMALSVEGPHGSQGRRLLCPASRSPGRHLRRLASSIRSKSSICSSLPLRQDQVRAGSVRIHIRKLPQRGAGQQGSFHRMQLSSRSKRTSVPATFVWQCRPVTPRAV